MYLGKIFSQQNNFIIKWYSGGEISYLSEGAPADDFEYFEVVFAQPQVFYSVGHRLDDLDEIRHRLLLPQRRVVAFVEKHKQNVKQGLSWETFDL